MLAACFIWNLTVIVVRPGGTSCAIGVGPNLVWLKLEGGHYEALITDDDAHHREARRQHSRDIPPYLALRVSASDAVSPQARDWTLRGGAKSVQSRTSMNTVKSPGSLKTIKSFDAPGSKGKPDVRSPQASAVSLKSVRTFAKSEGGPNPKRVGQGGAAKIDPPPPPPPPKPVAARASRSVKPPSALKRVATTAKRFIDNQKERVCKIRAAAAMLHWLHSPKRDAKRGWKCTKCSSVFTNLGAITTADRYCRATPDASLMLKFLPCRSAARLCVSEDCCINTVYLRQPLLRQTRAGSHSLAWLKAGVAICAIGQCLLDAVIQLPRGAAI